MNAPFCVKRSRADCHIESINVNVQRNQTFGQQKEGLNVNGNVGFRIVPK
jgi:hypothetical protein